MVKNLFIARGDIVWIDFSPTKGHEQSGLRPAVVVSPTEYNTMTGIVVVCPMTSKGKDYFFEVPVGGSNGKSFVLADQIRTFDAKERVKKITGKMHDKEMTELLARIGVLFQ